MALKGKRLAVLKSNLSLCIHATLPEKFLLTKWSNTCMSAGAGAGELRRALWALCIVFGWLVAWDACACCGCGVCGNLSERYRSENLGEPFRHSKGVLMVLFGPRKRLENVDSYILPYIACLEQLHGSSVLTKLRPLTGTLMTLVQAPPNVCKHLGAVKRSPLK